MRQFGRLMQSVGLLGPPLAIGLQLSDAITLGQMLILTVASCALFYIGWILHVHRSE